jgi:CrcB protein
VSVLLVMAGAAVGAPVRYLTDRAVMRQVQARTVGIFPWGTLTVNVAGCLLLGLVLEVTASGGASGTRLVLGTGFCGALSTYSTFSYETLRLAEEGSTALAVLNVLVSMAVGIAAAGAGALLGQGFGALM